MEKSVNFLFALLGVLGYSIMLSMVIFPSDGKNSKEVVIQPFKKDEAVLNDARFVAIYPYRALDYNGNDLKYCISNNGKKYYTTGHNENNYASWFNWNGCAHSRIYRVNPGQKIRFKITTDSCPGCVCTQPDFCIYQNYGGRWDKYDCLNLSVNPGAEKNYYFTPDSGMIMVASDTCFYLHLYYFVD